MSAPFRVAVMLAEHAAPVLGIQRLGITASIATFETEPPDWPRFTASRLDDHRFVALGFGGSLLG